MKNSDILKYNELIRKFMKESYRPYDYEWNELMRVVKKIKNKHDDKTHRHHTRYMEIVYGMGEVDIKLTYKAVVEFIEWYYKQLKLSHKNNLNK